MRIEDYIPEGPGISSDRIVRRKVKEANLRLEGKVILSSSSWQGYWMSSDPGEIEAYLREQTSRARTQAQNDEPARKLLASLRGDKMIRVRSYVRRSPGVPLDDMQERWEV